MADVLGEMVVKIVGDSKDLDKTLNKTEKELNGLGKTGTKTGATLAKAGALIQTAFVAAIVAGVAMIGKEMVTLAADAAESVNAVQVVFGEASGGILEFSENAVENLGLSSTAFNELSTVIGAQLKQSGISIDLLDDKVIELSTRAADVASVFNVDVNESLNAFGSALRGEAEPARRFGVNISDVAVQAEALASGLVKNKNEITDQIKIQARYNIILKQTADLAGDFENTQGSLTNQLKIAKAGVAEYGAELGQSLLPITTKTVTAFNNIIASLIESQKQFNLLRDITTEFRETGEVTGALDQLLAKREAILQQRQDAGREASFFNNEELQAINDAIAAEERRLEQQKIIDGFNKQASEGERLAAEQKAKEAEEERIRNEQRIADIKFRDELWGKTEEARIEAIEAEIAELETFKESDERAQQALAYLREELKGLKGDTEETTRATFVYGEEIDDLAAANDGLHASISAVSAATAEATEESNTFYDAMADGLAAGLSGFEDLALAVAGGEVGFTSFAKVALESLAEVLRGIGAQLASLASVAIVTSIMGKVTDTAAIGPALLGSAAAYTAAGLVGAAAASFADGGIVMPTPGGTIAQVAEAGQPEVIFPLDKLESLLGGQVGRGVTFVERPNREQD